MRKEKERSKRSRSSEVELSIIATYFPFLLNGSLLLPCCQFVPPPTDWLHFQRVTGSRNRQQKRKGESERKKWKEWNIVMMWSRQTAADWILKICLLAMELCLVTWRGLISLLSLFWLQAELSLSILKNSFSYLRSWAQEPTRKRKRNIERGTSSVSFFFLSFLTFISVLNECCKTYQQFLEPISYPPSHILKSKHYSIRYVSLFSMSS